MRPNTFLVGVSALALGVVLMVSPIGILNARDNLRRAKAEEVKMDTYIANEEAALSSLEAAKSAFESDREFDIAYSDPAGIYSVLSNVSGVEVKNTVIVDPLNNFVEKGMLVSGAPHAAVRMDLVVSDVDSVLSTVVKLQLPLVSVDYSYPNSLSITFLTGGAIK